MSEGASSRMPTCSGRGWRERESEAERRQALAAARVTFRRSPAWASVQAVAMAVVHDDSNRGREWRLNRPLRCAAYGQRSPP